MNTEQLRTLDKDIWKVIPKSYTTAYEWKMESRYLTTEELTLVKKACEECIVVPTNACFGFGFGIVLLDHPSCPGMKPERLISINSSHLGRDKKFEDGWKELFPLANTEQNRAWLKLYGLEDIKPKSYYEY